MAIPSVDNASLSFRLRVLDAVAMTQHRDAVMNSFDQFVLTYDPQLDKGPLWLNVPFKAHHDWAVAQAMGGGSHDPDTFQTAYALAASEVFFLHTVAPPGTGIPHPTPGAWEPTSLQAIPNGITGAIYVWEQDSNTGEWVLVCYADFALTDPSGSAPTSPSIVIDGVKIAVVEASLAYAERVGLGI